MGNNTKSKKKIHKTPPLFCWDIYMGYLQKTQIRIEDKKNLETNMKDKNYKRPGDLLKCLKTYDAIVVTNKQRKIKWASHGFKFMTGYDIDEAIGKKPTFLQGAKTDKEELKRISQQLSKLKRIETTVVNYKKSGMEYLCKILIEPVFDKNNKHIEFIAFEKEEVVC
jgi:PAS domain S-box-containing protein